MNILHYWKGNINRNEYRNKYDDDDDDDDIIQSEKTLSKRHTYTLNISSSAITDRSMSEKIESMSTIDSTNVIINESTAQIANMSNQIDRIDDVLYLYGVPILIFFCVISVAVNIKVLISVFWIRRPISPTLYISLSLAGNVIFFIFNNNIFFLHIIRLT